MSRVLVIGDSCFDIDIKSDKTTTYTTESHGNEIPKLWIDGDSIEDSGVSDGMGGYVAKLLESYGNTVKSLLRQTGSKTRFWDGTKLLMRLDSENSVLPFTIEEVERTIQSFHPEAIVICDYNKGSVTHELLEYLDNTSYTIVFCDTKKSDISQYKRIVFKINQIEFERLNGNTPNRLIVTRGENPPMWIDGNFCTSMMKRDSEVDVVDVIGAGDVFLAAYVNNWVNEMGMVQQYRIEYADKEALKAVQVFGKWYPK
jgi:bifunctional ADP-heptose synthase (sugar kinase/adenylyltransferase)